MTIWGIRLPQTTDEMNYIVPVFCGPTGRRLLTVDFPLWGGKFAARLCFISIYQPPRIATIELLNDSIFEHHAVMVSESVSTTKTPEHYTDVKRNRCLDNNTLCTYTYIAHLIWGRDRRQFFLRVNKRIYLYSLSSIQPLPTQSMLPAAGCREGKVRNQTN